MHFHGEVYIEKNENVEAQVEKIMEPYYEDYEGGFWDWWVMGGRWTGAHDKYDPAKDERNYEICYLCNGTGDRNYPVRMKDDEGIKGGIQWVQWAWYDINNVRHFKDEWAEKCNGCNGCEGTGLKLKHPSYFVNHEEDVMEVSQIPDDLTCYTLIVGEDVYQDFDEMGCSVKEMMSNLGITDGYLVTVDYHS